MAKGKCKMRQGSFVSGCHWKRGLETIFCTRRSMFVRCESTRVEGEIVQHVALYGRDFTTLTERTHDEEGML